MYLVVREKTERKLFIPYKERGEERALESPFHYLPAQGHNPKMANKNTHFPDTKASGLHGTNHDATDIALGLVHEAEAEPTDLQAATALRRKIDLRLMTLLCITYALQSIDKTTLGYAAVFGLQTDLDLHGTEYSWLGALFYLGYLAWEFPTNMMLQKLPINLFMSGTVSEIWTKTECMCIA